MTQIVSLQKNTIRYNTMFSIPAIYLGCIQNSNYFGCLHKVRL